MCLISVLLCYFHTFSMWPNLRMTLSCVLLVEWRTATGRYPFVVIVQLCFTYSLRMACPITAQSSRKFVVPSIPCPRFRNLAPARAQGTTSGLAWRQNLSEGEQVVGCSACVPFFLTVLGILRNSIAFMGCGSHWYATRGGRFHPCGA